MWWLLVCSVILNIVLIQDARIYATKQINKHRETVAHLRLLCEYIDLFIIKNNKIKKEYQQLDWDKLKNFKTVIERGLQYNSLVDLEFKNLENEGYYKLDSDYRRKLYMQSANMKVMSDEDIHKFAGAMVNTLNEIKSSKTL